MIARPIAGQRLTAIVLAPLAATFALLGCGDAHLKAAKTYAAQGQLPLAVHYLDEAVQRTGSEEARDAFVLTQGLYRYELRRDADRLVAARRYVPALSRLVQLQATAERAKAHGLPGDDPDQLSKQRASLVRQAVEQISVDLDQRQSRGVALRTDLATCRQLFALTSDEDTGARCAALRDRFRMHAAIQADGPTAAGVTANAFASSIANRLKKLNLELLTLVDHADQRLDARLEIELGPTRVTNTGWYLFDDEAFHTWVKRVDAKGRPITEKVTIHPTEEEIRKAADKQQPAPPSRVVEKQLWDRVAGRYRRYRSERTVTVTYRVTLRDLRDHEARITLAQAVKGSAASEYHTYEGDPRARRRDADLGPEGRHRAHPLPAPYDLLKPKLDGAATQIAKALAARVE